MHAPHIFPRQSIFTTGKNVTIFLYNRPFQLLLASDFRRFAVYFTVVLIITILVYKKLYF